jgi:hypothetical protein
MMNLCRKMINLMLVEEMGVSRMLEVKSSVT